MGIQSVTVVTSFPEKNQIHSARTVGVASYTKQLLGGLKQARPELMINVCAERFDKHEMYQENGIQVYRNWQRNNVLSFLKLWQFVIQGSETVLISFEAYMMGNVCLSGLFLLLVGIWNLRGKKIIFLVHQVPTEFRFIKGLRAWVMRFLSVGLWWWLRKLGTVIVFERGLKFDANVKVVPHFIPLVQQMDKFEARKQLRIPLDKKIALYFGYIAPYKGVDWLVSHWNGVEHDLIVAGGINPNHVGNKSIEQYVERVKNEADKRDILVTGFVPEEKIQAYFSAADVVVLPYEEFMSSSGPLSLVWAYEKPVIWTQSLNAYFGSSDIEHTAKLAGLNQDDVGFARNSSALVQALKTSESKRDMFVAWARGMKQERSLASVVEKLIEVIGI